MTRDRGDECPCPLCTADESGARAGERSLPLGSADRNANADRNEHANPAGAGLAGSRADALPRSPVASAASLKPTPDDARAALGADTRASGVRPATFSAAAVDRGTE